MGITKQDFELKPFFWKKRLKAHFITEMIKYNSSKY